ncbi:mechanosensitive ion channel domain-containing protein [Pseudodonghicola sp.]|uniref:mechanosensitive ion channel domain-containing protein n=1 Tax=Pseudodonghicola sp. TaxID=1969463 RepID=UPI003A96EBF5
MLTLIVPAGAQEAASATARPEPMTREAVREMVARMSDDQVRDLLLTRLDAVAAQQATPASGGFASQTVEVATRVGADLLAAVQGIPQIATLETVAISNFVTGYGRAGLFLLAGAVIFILTFNNTNGVHLGDSRIGFWLNTAVHAYIALIAWRARDGLTQMMRGREPDRTLTDERVARAYPYSAIVVIFVLLALGNIGIDITPLLAGAGLLGLAIGFGAQKLVSDVVSGIFFLIDDAFRIGEYVEVDGTAGTVEKISIRSMQLRHHRGPVHTIPYGEIPKLTNYSRDWVIMKLKFTVPFDTDPNKVKKIFKKIGTEMMDKPLYKDGFLEPFKSQGVFDFSEVGMVIRGKFMAKPGQQFTIRKEIYNRVKAEFGAAGIEFARPEVRIAMPEGHEEPGDAELQAAAKAAARTTFARTETP